MRRQTGNMWDVYGQGLFLITTNSYIRKDGALVMGRGIAFEALTRWPQIQLEFGRIIQQRCGHLGIYGLLVDEARDLGLFQVKKHFRASASTEIIASSTQMLIDWCDEHPATEVNLNYPGIGWGRLSEVEVEPIVRQLPDRVSIWTLHD